MMSICSSSSSRRKPPLLRPDLQPALLHLDRKIQLQPWKTHNNELDDLPSLNRRSVEILQTNSASLVDRNERFIRPRPKILPG